MPQARDIIDDALVGGPAQAGGSLSHESKKTPILNSSKNKQSKVCVCVFGLRLWMGYCNAWDTNL